MRRWRDGKKAISNSGKEENYMFGDDFFDSPTGGIFDLNRDGKMDAGERALEYDFIESFIDNDDDDDDDFDDLELELSEDDELREALEDAGLDAFELSYMDEDERREALEDAGLDPDDYFAFDFL